MKELEKRVEKQKRERERERGTRGQISVRCKNDERLILL